MCKKNLYLSSPKAVQTFYSYLSRVGTVGDGTGSSVLGNVTSPYFTVKNILVWSMSGFVAGTYRFTCRWYRFL